MDDATNNTSLGDRILAAARLAVTLHLEQEFLDRYQSPQQQQATIGGADQHGRVTDDTLPRGLARSEAA